MKSDTGKVHPSYLPWRAFEPVLGVLEFGAKKYAPHSWQGVDSERYAEALLRHAIEFASRFREEGMLCADHESGLPVLAHLACNALFLLSKESIHGKL